MYLIRQSSHVHLYPRKQIIYFSDYEIEKSMTMKKVDKERKIIILKYVSVNINILYIFTHTHIYIHVYVVGISVPC
jgi:hypothetical protein